MPMTLIAIDMKPKHALQVVLLLAAILFAAGAYSSHQQAYNLTATKMATASMMCLFGALQAGAIIDTLRKSRADRIFTIAVFVSLLAIILVVAWRITSPRSFFDFFWFAKRGG